MKCPNCGAKWNGIARYSATSTMITGRCLKCGERYGEVDAVKLLKEAEKDANGKGVS